MSGVLNLEDRGDRQTTRQSYKTSYSVAWVVGWKKVSILFVSGSIPLHFDPTANGDCEPIRSTGFSFQV